MVVVGAGLGGLCCAVELARQGLGVCVLEQHDKPGGYAHGFRRKGYRFDASLHHLGGLDEGAMARGLLKELGVLDKLEVHRRETLLRVELPDLDLRLPNDPAAMLRDLGERFPHERAGLVSFFETLRELKAHTTGPVVDPDFDLPPAERLSNRWADRTLAELVAEHVDDPVLASVLTAPWPYIGLPPALAAAGFGTCVLGSTWLEGGWQLRGGGAALSRALVERLEELGGRCILRAPVSEILVEQGRAAGVTLSDGRRILAPVVVSNANPFQTYRELLPSGAIPERYLRLLDSMEPSVSFYALYLGLDCPPSAVGVTEDEHFVAQHIDANRAWDRLLAGALEHTDWSVASMERADPDAAPPGGGVVTIMELTPAADWLELDREVYRERKADVKERLLAKVGQRFPALRDHIVVAELATPRTMHRYTRNHRGAVYGLAQLPRQAGRKRLSNRAPLPGLYLTGAWTWAGGGYEGALASGLQSADAVLLQNPAPEPRPRGRLTAPVDLAHPERIQVRASRDSVDSLGRVTPCAVLRFLDRGRVEACESTCSATEQEDWLQRYLVNVYRIDARFPTAGPQGALLEVRTGLRRTSSHRAVFDQRVVDASSGAVVAEARVEVTFLDPDQGLVPVPAGFEEGTAPARWDRPPPIPFTDRAHFPAARDRRAYYEDTDAQGIVYHVTYLRWCEEVIEELLGPDAPTGRIEALDIRYLEAARFADKVEIQVGARAAEPHRIAVDLRIVRREDETVMADATITLGFGDEPVPEALRSLVVDG